MESMRTTLTLEPDVAERVQKEVERSGRAMKTVVNQALRVGLGIQDTPRRPRRFEVKAHSFGFKPGVDLDRMNRLNDELEAEEAVRKLRR